jgi:hypothetical protein
MKKMLFTAIAMIAFSGASIANTIEIKEDVVTVVEKKATTPEVKVEDQLRSKCGAAGDAAYNYVISIHGTVDQAETALWNVIHACNHPTEVTAQ